MTLEVVAYNLESALRAQEGGADRIELCDNPGEGGTTPSWGMLKRVCEQLTIEVFVMIRPRGGDFFYSDEEFDVMKHDIEACKQSGADGVVFGILTAEGVMDKKRCRELIEMARPMKVTCHRAFDMTRDPFEAMDDCIETGFDRILTSGRQPKAASGAGLIGELIKKAAGRIAIMPGSGVDENTVGQIVRKTGATEIHFSAVGSRESGMTYRNSAIAGMGSAEGTEYQLRTVDPEKVRAMRRLTAGS